MAGGKQFDMPNFSDSVPPTPDRQGDMGPVHYVDEHTFESGAVPANTGAIESNWTGLVDSNGLSGGPVDGYRPTPVGGTYNPNGRGGSGSTERSGMS